MPHRHLGRLEGAELRRLFESSVYGLIDYPSHCLGKSGVFAAYVAHGCVVLNTAAPGPDTDGLQAGVHHHFLGLAGNDWHSDPQVTADAGRGWYATHALPFQSRDLARVCGMAFEEGRS